MLSTSEYYARILAPLSQVTYDMERNGVPFNVPAAEAMLVTVKEDEAYLRAELDKWVAEIDYIGPEMPPNWGSWQQLALVIYSPLGLNLPPAMFWKKGKTGWVETEDGEYEPEKSEDEALYKTDDVALEWLGKKHPGHANGFGLLRNLRWVLRARAYLEKWIALAIPRGGWWWLHPSFGLASDRDERAGARTGRFAVKIPPLQQVPQDPEPDKLTGKYKRFDYLLRHLFEAPPGWVWIVVDYSQLEMVILGHICHRLFGTDVLAGRFQPGKPDVHSLTAKYVFGEVLGDAKLAALPVELVKKEAKHERDIVKPVRYGLNYGKGARGFGDTLFMQDGTPLGEHRAQKVIDALLDFDPEIREYQSWVRKYIQRNEGICSLIGRWQPLPDANASRMGLRNRAWRQALNYPMQSGGQEVTALGMIKCWGNPELQALSCRQVLQVHDENCFLVPEDRAREAKEIIVKDMITAMQLDAPLAAVGGIAQSWGQAKA